MKKVCKILFLMFVIMSIIFAFSSCVKAIDVDGYEDLDEVETTQDNTTTKEDEEEKQNNKTEKEQETTETEEKKDGSEADKEHATTGVYNNQMYITVAIITAIAIIFAYSKFKKYNY